MRKAVAVELTSNGEQIGFFVIDAGGDCLFSGLSSAYEAERAAATHMAGVPRASAMAIVEQPRERQIEKADGRLVSCRRLDDHEFFPLGVLHFTRLRAGFACHIAVTLEAVDRLFPVADADVKAAVQRPEDK